MFSRVSVKVASPKLLERLTFGALSVPRLVVIIITPFAPRTPYTAVADASFRIEMDSISFGSILLNVAASMPSTIINGADGSNNSVDWANVPTPRILNVEASWPGAPLFCTERSPGIRPTSALLIFACGD